MTAVSGVDVSKDVCTGRSFVPMPMTILMGWKKSKYDLFNAYKLDVSSVVYDKLSAETAGNDGDSLIDGMTHWTAARLEGSNCPQYGGSRTSLDVNTFKANLTTVGLL